jgi:transposase
MEYPGIHQQSMDMPRTAMRSLKLDLAVRGYVDGGFSGKAFFKTVIDAFAIVLEVMLRPRKAKGFVLLPHRWLVEHTYGGLHGGCRLNVDYERLPEFSEVLIHIAMKCVIPRRLA